MELRLPSEDDLVELARLAEDGIHPPEQMPFYVPWTDRIGEPGFVDDFVAFHLRQRREWTAERWQLLLGTWADGHLAGVQGLDAQDSPRAAPPRPGPGSVGGSRATDTAPR